MYSWRGGEKAKRKVVEESGKCNFDKEKSGISVQSASCPDANIEGREGKELPTTKGKKRTATQCGDGEGHGDGAARQPAKAHAILGCPRNANHTGAESKQ